MACAWPAWRAAAGERSPLETPHLDRLAAGGTRLNRHYVNNPLCMPGRSTLITGLTPRAHGVRTNGIDLDRGIPTVVQALAGAGYRTHSSGKTHFRIMAAPNGADPLALDPLAFPEARPLWERGRIDAIPVPYYGFQTVDWTGGHGDVFGDYRTWLRGVDPDAPRLLARRAGTPPASGAEQAWKMAIPPELHYNTWIADRTMTWPGWRRPKRPRPAGTRPAGHRPRRRRPTASCGPSPGAPSPPCCAARSSASRTACWWRTTRTTSGCACARW